MIRIKSKWTSKIQTNKLIYLQIYSVSQDSQKATQKLGIESTQWQAAHKTTFIGLITFMISVVSLSALVHKQLEQRACFPSWQ